MIATEKEVLERGLHILSDLNVNDYFKDKIPKVKRSTITRHLTSDKRIEEEGWRFLVSAPNWQFGRDDGVYAIHFLSDGTPHKIFAATGGRGQTAFITKDENGKYKAVATVEEI